MEKTLAEDAKKSLPPTKDSIKYTIDHDGSMQEHDKEVKEAGEAAELAKANPNDLRFQEDKEAEKATNAAVDAASEALTHESVNSKMTNGAKNGVESSEAAEAFELTGNMSHPLSANATAGASANATGDQ